MKKKRIIGIGILISSIIVIIYFVVRTGSKSDFIITKANQGDFLIGVITTGELLAKNSDKIYGPSGLRTVRIWQVEITEMIADGTIVDSGDFVAELDRSEITNKIKDLEIELDKLNSEFTKTRLDTTLELRNTRDELINLEYAYEEKQITLDQSKYEPPATIRQAKIELEKAQRAYGQAVKNYKLKLEKSQANMQQVAAELAQTQNKYNEMVEILHQFTINAPKAGMVIYKRDWNGRKQGIGSNISAWNNVVATLPDLSEMISKTYVNEIDISKVRLRQKVNIGIDAFPEKAFTGEVFEIANIGQQLPNTNAKVFEVLIMVNEFDSILRPAMTTKNEIITEVVEDVVHIPLECLHNNDSISFVYSMNGRVVKQEVEVGKANENEIIILNGLKKGDKILMIPPEEEEKLKIKYLAD